MPLPLESASCAGRSTSTGGGSSSVLRRRALVWEQLGDAGSCTSCCCRLALRDFLLAAVSALFYLKKKIFLPLLHERIPWKRKVDQENKSPTPSAGILEGAWKAGRWCLSPSPTLAWCGAAPVSREGREWGLLPPRVVRFEGLTHFDSAGRQAVHKLLALTFPLTPHLLFLTLTISGDTSSISTPAYVPQITRTIKYAAADGHCVSQSWWSAKRAGFALGSQYLQS